MSLATLEKKKTTSPLTHEIQERLAIPEASETLEYRELDLAIAAADVMLTRATPGEKQEFLRTIENYGDQLEAELLALVEQLNESGEAWSLPDALALFIEQSKTDILRQQLEIESDESYLTRAQVQALTTEHGTPLMMGVGYLAGKMAESVVTKIPLSTAIRKIMENADIADEVRQGEYRKAAVSFIQHKGVRSLQDQWRDKPMMGLDADTVDEIRETLSQEAYDQLDSDLARTLAYQEIAKHRLEDLVGHVHDLVQDAIMERAKQVQREGGDMNQLKLESPLVLVRSIVALSVATLAAEFAVRVDYSHIEDGKRG